MQNIAINKLIVTDTTIQKDELNRLQVQKKDDTNLYHLAPVKLLTVDEYAALVAAGTVDESILYLTYEPLIVVNDTPSE